MYGGFAAYFFHTYSVSPNLQLALLRHHLLSLCHPCNGIGNHLIHNLLGGLLLVHNRSRLAHQERPGIVHGLIIDIITQFLEVVFYGDGTLGGEVLDFLGTVFFPIFDVGIVADAEGSALREFVSVKNDRLEYIS